MTSCLYVLVTAWAAAGPTDPGCACGQQPVQREFVQVAPADDTAPDGASLRDRLRHFFGVRVGPQMYEVVPGPTMAARPAPATPYNGFRAAPAPASDEQAEPTVIVESAAPTAEPDALKSLKVATKYQDRVGHEDGYGWITGHLFYVHGDGGRWVIRYALPDQIDRYGGSVVLAPGVEMRNFREGDLVCVHGSVLDGRGTGHGPGALYRVDAINLVERADP